MSVLLIKLRADASTLVAGLQQAGWGVTKLAVRLYWPDRLPST